MKLQTTSSIETEVEDEFENLLMFKENENEDADTVIQFENLPDDAKVSKSALDSSYITSNCTFTCKIYEFLFEHHIMIYFIDNKKTEDHISVFCCVIYGGKRANEYRRHCKWI